MTEDTVKDLSTDQQCLFEICQAVCRGSGVNPGGWEVAAPDFGHLGSWTGSEILLLSYYLQEVCSKVVTFEEK